MTRSLCYTALLGALLCTCAGARAGAEREWLAGQWTEGGAASPGASRDFLNKEAKLRWRGQFGDWCDASGQPFGDQPFSSASGGPYKQIHIDATGVVREHMRRGNQYPDIVLRGSSGGQLRVHSREADDFTLRPYLAVESTGGAKVFDMVEDTFIDRSTTKALGKGTTLTISPEHVTFLRFDLGDLAGEVTRAVVVMPVMKQYGATTRFSVYTSCAGDDELPAVRPGIAAAYPNDAGLADHPAVVMVDDFDAGNWGGGPWTYGADSPNVRVLDSDTANRFEPHHGSALRVRIPRGESLGVNMGYQFRKATGSEPEEMYARYYLRFGESWSTTQGGKLPGFSGTYGRAGWGGRRADGYNGWSARGAYYNVIADGNPLAGLVPIGNYVYYATQPSQYGWGFVWTDARLGFLEKNRWYSIEQHVRLNTPGKADGVLETWVDGRPAHVNRAFEFRHTADLKIEQFWLNLYHGGTGKVRQDTDLFIDNVVIAREYIGPMATP